MYCGKRLSFLAFNSTSFLSSNKGSKGKKTPKNPVDGKEFVEGVRAHGGHSAASELPTPYLVFHNLWGSSPVCHTAGPHAWQLALV